MKYFLFLVTTFVLTHSVFGQYSSKNKKAVKLFKEAQVVPSQQIDPKTGYPDFGAGVDILNKCLLKDPNFWEAYLLRAEFHLNLREKSEAITDYENALRINPEHSRTGMTFFQLGDLYLDRGDYAKSLQYIRRFLKNPNANSDYLKLGKLIYESALFSVDAIKNPVSYEPINAGPGINTVYAEYYPTLTVNGNQLLFTRALPHGSNNIQEDFFTSVFSGSGWEKAFPMPNNVNTERNEGAPSVSANGRGLVFVACPDENGDYGDNRKGKGSCDLYYTERIGDKWLNPLNIPGDINTYHWETQPSLSADGKTLYFIRGLRGKGADYRNSDIYVSRLGENGRWMPAERLPDIINTPYAEESVHIHPDGKTLYFASRGHAGLGGSDLFVSQLGDDGKWSKPKNLGYPINTLNDENSLIVAAQGNIAFFASDRAGGFGDLDIYMFELPKNLQPTTTYYFDGKVFDAVTISPLGGHFTLKDISTGEVVIISDADPITGKFTVPLPSNRQYVIDVSFNGYIPTSLGFDLTYNENQTTYHLDIPMNSIGSGKENILQNIYFDLNSAKLRKESFVELNNLANFLRGNSSLKIELGGHTDTRGEATDNLKLSSERAKAVYDYLIQTEGIAATRLSYTGYGETFPIVSDTEIAKLSELEKEKAHQKNRRTVYKILN
jgi:outer membrane protein OmpA-like peptidoglycan-associated protein/tetratricopeptide (TPR) repeat protein